MSDRDFFGQWANDEDELDRIADANEAEWQGLWDEAERRAEHAGIAWSEALHNLIHRLP